jgi:cyclopropane fatty-acyl-phospholipid synthase-like methyltransferase
MEYLEEYCEYINKRLGEDPKEAIGGLWRELGNLQFNFLVKKGLKPDNTLLDVGCGTLRGGRKFIDYLDPQKYYGIDISAKAIMLGVDSISSEKFAYKMPRFIVNKDLKFREFNREIFDYILAQSVFTHLPKECIEECFENIKFVMHNKSKFYFTFFYETKYKRGRNYKFRYPLKYFKSLAKRYGYKIKDLSSEYLHPRGQWMIEMTL